MTSEIFISKFHNVEGVLVGERKRNIQNLLRNEIITADQENIILDKFKPRTYLETLLYIDILIYLKKTFQLLEILKNGNEACVHKIIKQTWFFHEGFHNVGAEELVDNILPTLSFSVKIKLLKKLSVVFPEEKMDEVFDAVLNRYGLFIATTVIPRCSPQKIEEILKNNEVELWTSQLKIIYNKQPNLINIYLEEHKKQKSEKIFDNNFLVYVAQSNPTFFWTLLENHEINDNFKLGRRTTKKLIMSKKQDIINEPKKYIKYLRHETLVRNLNKLGEFKQLYRNLFPRDIEKLDNGKLLCNKLLKYHPKRDQYKLYTETFKEVLNEDILSNLSYLDDSFLEVIPDKDVREMLAHLKYREYNNDEYLKYYDVGKCFNLIKQKINVTAGIKDRAKLLVILVKSCAINKDLIFLEQVLKYFCDRHRNDDAEARAKFLDTVESNFKPDELNETHWKYIKEIFTIQTLNKEYSGRGKKLRMTYIKYLYKNNRTEDEINSAILEFLGDQVLGYMIDFKSISYIKDPKIEKEILMKAVEYVPKILKNLNMEIEVAFFLTQMFADIYFYNLRYPELKIVVSENEKLKTILRNILENNYYLSYPFQGLFIKAICKLNRDDFDNEMLTYYWKKTFQMFCVNTAIKWYLKYDPLVIVENFDKILNVHIMTIMYNVWPSIKLYSHLNLDGLFIKYLLERLNDESNKEDKTQYVQPLSVLTAPEYYIEIMKNGNFIPTSPKLVIENYEAKNFYKLQRAFISSCKNLKDLLKYLPMLMDTCCRGDYLQTSLKFLYTAFYKCPENELRSYLDKLSKNNAMSVKKHALSLACCVFDQQAVIQIFKNFETEKNISLRKFMFLSSLKYFSKNPTDILFEIVVSFMNLLEEHDTESLKMLHTINISKDYKPFYVQHILKVLEKFKHKDKEGKLVEFNTVISSILDLINVNCIQKLPQHFCKEVIQNYFLIENNEKNQNIGSIFPFVIKFLIYREETNNNFEFVFKLLCNFKLKIWSNYSMIEERETIYTFFKNFYTMACEKKVASDFVELFSQKWKEIFTPVDTFEEYILLNLLQFKKDSEKEPEMHAKKIVLFSEQLIQEFGQNVLSKFISLLAKSFPITKKERINLLSKMLKFKTTRLNCILVIELITLKQDFLYKDKVRPMYRQIDFVLKGITDPNVRLCYNYLYLKK